MNTKKLEVLEDDESLEFSAISRLIELGHQKSYVTIDDILHFFPDAEQDVSQLEEAFAALMAAGIQYIDDDDLAANPTEDELGKDEIKEIVDDSQDTTVDDLKHMIPMIPSVCI